MDFIKQYSKQISIAVLLSMLVFFNASQNNTFTEIIISLPYFLLLYFLLFAVGDSQIAPLWRSKIDFSFAKAIIFPSAMIFLLYSYILLTGGNPFKQTIFLLPSLLLIPTLVYIHPQARSHKVNWIDFALVIFYLLPLTMIDFPAKGDLPVGGGGFDTIYRVVMMLCLVYGVVVLRDLKDVGFEFVFKWKYFIVSITSWLAFYAIVIILGYASSTLALGQRDALTFSALFAILSIFFHTAIFEELFFRGLIQNLLQKKIYEINNWKKYWLNGAVVLTALSLWAGYSLNGRLQWFIAFITVLLFILAYFLEKRQKSPMGTYTALAVTSALFGLAHYHSGLIIYIGLASLAGWFYGYTYIKTRNIFYAALVHALVNGARGLIGFHFL